MHFAHKDLELGLSIQKNFFPTLCFTHKGSRKSFRVSKFNNSFIDLQNTSYKGIFRQNSRAVLVSFS